MSRSASRERKRRKRLEALLLQAIARARGADAKTGDTAFAASNDRLLQTLRELDRADVCLWDMARAIGCTEEENAMIAQIVAPKLAGMTPGSVLRRSVLRPRGTQRTDEE